MMNATVSMFQARYEDMKDSLTRRAVSPSDTCILLDDYHGDSHADMRVAHISSCGWIDLFHYVLNGDDLTQSDHISLTPSQAESLIAAYAEWKESN